MHPISREKSSNMSRIRLVVQDNCLSRSRSPVRLWYAVRKRQIQGICRFYFFFFYKVTSIVFYAHSKSEGLLEKAKPMNGKRSFLRFAIDEHSLDVRLHGLSCREDCKNKTRGAFASRVLFQRRGRDSNPGTSKLVNGFRDRPVRPLRHLSFDFQ